MGKEKKRFGDRKDGRLIRELDPMHFITPLLYPNRCDNEAYISVNVDLENINRYVDRLNEQDPEFRYTMFHIIVVAIIKVLTLRPKMNRFIANKNFYQRNEVSASFVVKKRFDDHAEEGLAFIHAKPESTLFTLMDDLKRQITAVKSQGAVDASSDAMDLFNKMPRFFSKFIVWIITRLDVHGWVPKSLIATDPYYSSVVLSNLGSIKLKSGYHHLTNWGTCSLFCIIGEKKMTPVYDEDGNVTMRQTLDLGLTVDERLADGYYYSKSIRLLKHLLQNPELLELPVSEEVQYE
ncbi:MAG: 2-oxo acid dehydrogenase subunit E2 [Oscillospiraceae bacterium]|nr:2-oxo acid dehydrogenase subunit E2 [Oscillospiraceae bacterium]